MTEELLTRIRKGILDYQAKHGCTKEELAEHFVRSIAFSPNNTSFKLAEIKGWKVLEEDDIGDIIIHECHTKEEAQQKFDKFYPDGATKEASGYLMYEASIELIPKAGTQARSQIDLSEKSESDAIDEIVKIGAPRIADHISGILKTLKDEDETGIMNNVNPKNISEAVAKRVTLQKSLEERRAEAVFGLLRGPSGKEKYIVPEDSWQNQQMANKGEKIVYPNLAKMQVEPTVRKSIGYSLLLELDRFLSGKLGVSVGMVLANVHPELAKNFGANPKWRDSISGSPNTEVLSEGEEFNFGKHLGSNLIEMIDEMANKGFDVQPIFDARRGGNCIGVVKLSDIVGLMSDMSFELRAEHTVSELLNYGTEGLIRSPPPQIDASTDLSIAGNILKHGNESLIVKFDPQNWFGSEHELEQISQIIEPGYHIMTAHDIIAFRLLSN